jgi:mono/diheme cytochrome c family protein
MRPLLSVTLALFAALGAAPALSAGEPDQGLGIARTWCGGCHLVDGATQSSARDAVPTFASIARRPGMTAERLDTFLQKPHGGMPDLALNQHQIDDVVAYLMQLRSQ